MAIYYFRPGGSDAADGLSHATAWKTWGKVATVSFAPGDRLRFECGGEYFSASEVPFPSSGSVGNPIVVESYGTGAKPKFTSFFTPTEWVSIGGGRWTCTHASFGSTVKTVKFDGQLKGKGRFPGVDQFCRISDGAEATILAGGVAWVESGAGVDPPDWHVPLPATDYTGAQLCIRKNQYNYHVAKIDSMSGGRIYYGSDLGTVKGQYVPIPGFGFFIQNHLSCLTELGDWMYDAASKTVTVHFGAENPADHSVQIAVSGHGFGLANRSYIRIEGLEFEGFNHHGARLNNSHYVDIILSAAGFCGSDGIGFEGASNSHCSLTWSELQHCHGNGTYADYGSHHITVEHNKVHHISLVIGGSEHYGNADSRGIGVCLQNGAGNIIRHNQIYQIGFNSIVINGNGFIVYGNILNGYNLIKTDGSGIYAYKGVGGPVITTRAIIERNICVNGIGYAKGTNEPELISYGIYADDLIENLGIYRNLCAYNAMAGIYFHNTKDIICQHNTFFGNLRQFNFAQDNGFTIRDMVFTDNRIYCNQPHQTFAFALSAPMEVSLFGTFARNTYRYVENHIGRFGVHDGTADVYNQFKSFAEWAALVGEEDSTCEAYQHYAPANPTVLATLVNQTFSTDGSQTGSGLGQFSIFTGATRSWADGKAILSKSGGKKAAYQGMGPVSADKVYLVTPVVAAATDLHVSLQPETTFEDEDNHAVMRRIHAGTTPETHRIVFEGLTGDLADQLLWMFEAGDAELHIDSLKVEEIAPFDFESSVELLYNAGEADQVFSWSGAFRKNLDTDEVTDSIVLAPGEFTLISLTEEEPVDPEEPEEPTPLPPIEDIDVIAELVVE